MPTYEYACKSCGQHVEVVQSFHDAPLTTCSSCGGPLRKVFGAIGIAFKGSGFYKTDSRSSTTARPAKGAKSEPSTAPAPAASADGSSAGDTSNKTSESKPAAS